MDSTTHNPGFKVNIKYMPTDYHHVLAGSVGTLAKNMVPWNNSSVVNFNVGGGDKETRPVNIYFHYIIKVAQTVTIPLGAVVPYAGSDDNSPDMPTWLACNGNSYSATSNQYKALFNIIGKRFTNTSGATNFRVPELRGIFIRGVDTGSGKDPDADIRVAAPDGSTGRQVGTLQQYGTSSSGFTVNIPHFPPDDTYGVYAVSGHNNLHNSPYKSDASFEGGASESRPKNASVQYYIHGFEATGSNDGFPIGGIIAVPGNGTPNPDYWAVADGSSVPRDGQYVALWAVMLITDPSGTAWGAEDDHHFNLPNLAGRCLRATDTTNFKIPDPWGDPDRGNRQSTAPGGTSQGTGSVQNDATSPPKNGFSISNLNYPSDVVSNAATAIGEEMSEYHKASQGFSLKGPDVTETAPTCVSVRFFVKYASA